MTTGNTSAIESYLTGPRQFIVHYRKSPGRFAMVRFWTGGDVWYCSLRFTATGFHQSKCKALYWRTGTYRGRQARLALGPELSPLNDILTITEARQPAPTTKNGIAFCLTSSSPSSAWAFFNPTGPSTYDMTYAPNFGGQACPGLWFTEVPLG